jgi:FlaA1/EpsC-like NDP-sugar epimerase
MSWARTGSVAPLFKQQIERGGPLTVTHPDSRRYFLSMGETVDLILAAAALNEDAAILIPELGAPVKILDFANRLIREAGRNAGEIEVVFTGLRPGDKLREDLCPPGEWLEPTVDSRLRKANFAQTSPGFLDSALQAISEGVRSRNVAALIETLSRVVPDYQPSEMLRGLLNPSPV